MPAPILDLASRLLPLAAPQVAPSRSIRTVGDDPWITRVAPPDDLLAELVRRVGVLGEAWGSIGVVAPGRWHAPALEALAAARLDVAAGDRGGLDHQVAVLEPPTAKGLEFDAVVVVEPADFLVDGPTGARLLYVAMTRSVQHLSVLHADPLPAVLAGGHNSRTY